MAIVQTVKEGVPWVPVTLTIVTTTVSKIGQKQSPVKPLVAGALWAIALSGIASWNEGVATGFAWLVALTAFILSGPNLMNLISKAV